MANTLTQLEEWRVASPLYSDWSDYRLTAYHDITTDLFTIGRFTLTRQQFIKRYGEPGAVADIIRWQPPESADANIRKWPPEKMRKKDKNVTFLIKDSRLDNRNGQSRHARRDDGVRRIA